MATPDYSGDMRANGDDPARSDALNEFARIVTSGQRLHALTEGHLDRVNDAVDAQMDILLSHFGGDERLALFAVVNAYGIAMRTFSGEFE